MTVHYSDLHLTLHQGDAFEVAGGMADGSVNCIVTSPPYFGLRDYGHQGQYGSESSPAEYVERMRTLFTELRRVLADDGTLWLNLGDSYASSGGREGVGPRSLVASTQRQATDRTRPQSGMPAKNLLGIPWRVAFALQDDGWTLRNAIVWNKPNAMPESVTDRLSNRHELIFMFSKSRRYWFDLDPIREATQPQVGLAATFGRTTKEQVIPNQSATQHRADRPAVSAYNEAGRNPGDVWTIPTTPFPGAHFAVFPPEIPRRCIAAGCKPGGVVLDPFSGSGTTGMAAAQLGRRYIGVDLNVDYLDLSLRTRLQQITLLDEETA